MWPDPLRLDRGWLRAAFERAARSYDREAELQREVADRLLDRLDAIRLQPRRIADLGAGTGYCTRRLSRRYPAASLYAIDIAHGMLLEARGRAPRWFSRQRFACSDAQCLAVKADAFDLLFSNLTLQWCEDLRRTLGELWRVTAPGGLLLFSTLGPDTLRELRESWAEVDTYGHVNPFLDLHLVGDALLATGYRDVVVDVDRLRRYQPDLLALMRHLKALGAHNVTSARPRHLLGRERLDRLRRAYEARREDRGLPLTFEVVYGLGWKPPGTAGVDVAFSTGPRRESRRSGPRERI